MRTSALFTFIEIAITADLKLWTYDTRFRFIPADIQVR